MGSSARARPYDFETPRRTTVGVVLIVARRTEFEAAES